MHRPGERVLDLRLLSSGLVRDGGRRIHPRDQSGRDAFYVIAAMAGWVGPLLLVAVFSLIGRLAAIFLLPEVYGFECD